MKYGNGHEPMVCLLSKSKCYKNTTPMTVKGVLWHSTGCINPNLRRYVQPADDDPRRAELIEIIGKNDYNNDYNHGDINKQTNGMNAWIGKLKDGTVTTIQVMNWGWAPWGCGGGDKGSCNNGWIQFEICEDDLTDPEYAAAAYREACELTAYLCAAYHLDPHGMVRYKGVDVPVILDHRESHMLKLGSNHADVKNWFPGIIGKYLDDIRDDVAALMAGESVTISESTLRKGAKGDNVRDIQTKLIELGYNLGRWGADGDYGSATEAAVMAFQRDHGIEATGIVENALVSLIEGCMEAVKATYTCILRRVPYAEMKAMEKRWGDDCEVITE